METGINEPTIDHVRDTFARYAAKGVFEEYDAAVRAVFEQWPKNVDIGRILAKVAVLDRLYYTNVYYVLPVAEHIIGVENIDAKLTSGDYRVINEIASIQLGEKKRTLYSFSTKYCHWHNPEMFQIFDGYVERILCAYQKKFRFAEFQHGELRDYSRFVEILERLRSRFHLSRELLSGKELDKFLWIEYQNLNPTNSVGPAPAMIPVRKWRK